MKGSVVKEGEKVRGTVEWFNDAKGYGFLNVEGQETQIFVHHTGIRMEGFRTLKAGARVEFVINHGPKGLQAEEVTAI